MPTSIRTEPAAAGATPLRALLALLAVQLCFASFPTFGKRAMLEIAPATVAGYRVLCGGLTMLILVRLLHARQWRVPRARWPKLILAGQLGVTINQVLFVEGLSRARATDAGLMMAVIPPATWLLALLAGHERWNNRQGAGLLLGLCGVGLLIGTEGDTVGQLLLLVNALSYSAYLVLIRPLVREHPPLVILAYAFWAALIPVLLYVLTGPGLDVGHATVGARWALAGILLFPTVGGYVLNTVALRDVPASVAAAWVMLQPPIAVGSAALFLDERLGWLEALAGALILSGLALVSLRRRRAARPPRS